MSCKHFLAAALFLLTILPASTAAQAQQWVQLGCRDVDLNVDRDVIQVGARDGRFSAVRLRAAGNAVQMLDLKVVYANGNADDIPVRARIREGGTSGVLDLRGADRAIDRIEMIYARVPNFRGRARICVDGRQAQAAAAGWVQLGCRDVDLNVDRDVVQVDRRDGRFSAIRLRAAGNAVQMFDLKVIYGNGEPDDIPVRARIPEGGTSGPLDLRGRDRAIDRIQMIYARVPNFRGRARICVDGRAA
ncbi:MAG TPA: hypothetical protein VFK79_06325 [Xanthobacteraceae bacterium]|nr:hypothetical protein [Xanthobacteraceae bacterium]